MFSGIRVASFQTNKYSGKALTSVRTAQSDYMKFMPFNVLLVGKGATKLPILGVEVHVHLKIAEIEKHCHRLTWVFSYKIHRNAPITTVCDFFSLHQSFSP
uniref:Uncharacterized protein n=1 Tax=Micrurus spixii TaxID=129469 RepID=A0A2D4MKT1_9SAUR